MSSWYDTEEMAPTVPSPESPPVNPLETLTSVLESWQRTRTPVLPMPRACQCPHCYTDTCPGNCAPCSNPRCPQCPKSGGCACEECSDGACEGDCPQCEDHGCQQCWGADSGYDCDDHECSEHYPDGCPGNDLSSCCGECSQCDRHNPDHDRPDVCERGFCHECDHYCD